MELHPLLGIDRLHTQASLIIQGQHGRGDEVAGDGRHGEANLAAHARQALAGGVIHLHFDTEAARGGVGLARDIAQFTLQGLALQSADAGGLSQGQLCHQLLWHLTAHHQGAIIHQLGDHRAGADPVTALHRQTVEIAVDGGLDLGVADIEPDLLQIGLSLRQLGGQGLELGLRGERLLLETLARRVFRLAALQLCLGLGQTGLAIIHA